MGTDEAPEKPRPAGDDLAWKAAVPFPPELLRQLEALTVEIGVVDRGTPIVRPVALSELKPH